MRLAKGGIRTMSIVKAAEYVRTHYDTLNEGHASHVDEDDFVKALTANGFSEADATDFKNQINVTKGDHGISLEELDQFIASSVEESVEDDIASDSQVQDPETAPLPSKDKSISADFKDGFSAPAADPDFEPSGADFDESRNLMWVVGDEGQVRAYNAAGEIAVSQQFEGDFEGVTVGDNGDIHALKESLFDEDPTEIVTMKYENGQLSESGRQSISGLPTGANGQGAEAIEYLGDNQFLVGSQTKDAQGNNVFLVENQKVSNQFNSELDQVSGMDVDTNSGIVALVDTDKSGNSYTLGTLETENGSPILNVQTDRQVLETEGQVEGVASFGSAEDEYFFTDDNGPMTVS